MRCERVSDFDDGAFCIGLASLAGVGALMSERGRAARLIRPRQGELKSSDLIVHEWGTFLGMSGSDGASLDGMYHEEHALPAFVHSRSRDQLRLPFVLIKGETPVIYFYTKVRQQVRVGVGFPRGIWTQWYPQAILVNPSAGSKRRDSRPPEWRPHLLASRGDSQLGRRSASSRLPATSSDALWNHARRGRCGVRQDQRRHQGSGSAGVGEVPVLPRPGRGSSARPTGLRGRTER